MDFERVEVGTSAERISTSLLEGGEDLLEWCLNARLKVVGRRRERPWSRAVRKKARRSGRGCWDCLVEGAGKEG